MSIDGIRNAKWIGRVQPMRAKNLAAELRNAVTPASLVAHCEQEHVADILADILASVAHVLAIADALESGSLERAHESRQSRHPQADSWIPSKPPQ